MKDTASLHQKVQEHCDCFALSDPLKEMAAIGTEPDSEGAAVKWLALAALHGVNSNAAKITLTRDRDGAVAVTAVYRGANLPSPGKEIGARVVRTIREITHISEDKGKTELALGMRDSSLSLRVKVKSKSGRERITLKFPE